MNPYPIPIIPDHNTRIIEELKCIREQLMSIQNTLENLTNENKKNYLEKDDNYYII